MSMNAQGLFVAAAVGTLFATAGCASDDSNENTVTTKEAVHCLGINECKGLSECAGPKGENSCQGLNECKGMGWISVASEQDCADQGGTVLES